MYADRVAAVGEIGAKSRHIREKQKQKRKLAGAIFLEIIVRKIWECEQGILFGIGQKAPQPATEHREAAADSAPDGEDTSQYCSFEEGFLRERMVPTGDLLELTLPQVRELISESYEQLLRVTALIRKVAGSPIYRASYSVFEQFYVMAETREAFVRVEEAFHGCCVKYCGGSAKNAVVEHKTAILEVYEHFCHANAYWAVRQNNEEGKHIVEEGGLDWAGTSYYDAHYYYRWKNAQRRLFAAVQRELEEVCEAERPVVPENGDYGTGGRFFLQGGTTFHSMWQWMQSQNNYPGDQYGLREDDAEPPLSFVYLYRNMYSSEDAEKIHVLLERLDTGKGRACTQWEWLAVTDRYYNNGSSYLIDFEPRERCGCVSGEQYEAAIGFLRNFRLYRVSGCLECLFLSE